MISSDFNYIVLAIRVTQVMLRDNIDDGCIIPIIWE